MTDRDTEFKKAQAEYSKNRSSTSWQKMFALVYNCCQAVCLKKNYKNRDNMEDLISNATLICMERLQKEPGLQVRKLSSFCYYPCLEQLAERKKIRRKTYSFSEWSQNEGVDSDYFGRLSSVCANITNRSMNIQSISKMLGKNGCLLFCDLMLMDVNPAMALADYEDYVREGIIEPDCYVKDHNKLMAFYGKSGRYVRVKERPTHGKYIACYKNGDVTHFVLINADLNHAVYDPLGKSNTVVNGVEVQEWRVIR